MRTLAFPEIKAAELSRGCTGTKGGLETNAAEWRVQRQRFAGRRVTDSKVNCAVGTRNKMRQERCCQTMLLLCPCYLKPQRASVPNGPILKPLVLARVGSNGNRTLSWIRLHAGTALWNVFSLSLPPGPGQCPVRVVPTRT